MGDRWTLFVVRDLLTGKRAYKELLERPEGISTNHPGRSSASAWRLVERQPVREGSSRAAYILTRKGADLLPTRQALCRWGHRHLDDTWRPPATFMRDSPSEILKRLEGRGRATEVPRLALAGWPGGGAGALPRGSVL